MEPCDARFAALDAGTLHDKTCAARSAFRAKPGEQ
jgi:hypothetical protein